MEQNKKTIKAKVKTKIMPIKKTPKSTTKSTTKKTKTAKCCSTFSGKKKCITKIIIGLVILAIIITGAILLTKALKKDPSKVDTKRPLDMSNNQQTETGEIIETYLLDEELPVKPEVIAQGRFNDVEQTLEGKALFIKSDGETYLRFEKFKTINGQDLHVYLSPILNLDAGDTIDLGLLKSVSGNFNYKIEKDIDIEKYSNVIIWSNPFDAFFGYASLINKELNPEPETEATEMTDEEKAQQDAENNPQMPLVLDDEMIDEIEADQGETENTEEEAIESETQESTEEVTKEESVDNENTETTEEEIDTEENTEAETENTENQ